MQHHEAEHSGEKRTHYDAELGVVEKFKPVCAHRAKRQVGDEQ